MVKKAYKLIRKKFIILFLFSTSIFIYVKSDNFSNYLGSRDKNQNYKRNPFVYGLSEKQPFQCHGYAFIKRNDNNSQSCAFVNINNVSKRICVNDKIGKYTIKDIRPEGIVVCAGDFCQKLICFN